MRTYDDPIKKVARAKLKEFIGKYLLTKRKPEQIRVVCFPGAEVEGEEALEVKEVYDALGIPRKNITGLEYNPEFADRLRKADLGIEVVCADALDFFKKTMNCYDIISLDYTGPRTWKESDITKYISGRGKIKKPGVFTTNHCIKREAPAVKGCYIRRTELISPDLEVGQKEVDEFYSKLREKIRGIDEKTLDLDILRDKGITHDNLTILQGGIIELNPEKSAFAKNSRFTEMLGYLKYREISEEDKAVLRRIDENKGVESDLEYHKKRLVLSRLTYGVINMLNKEYHLPKNISSNLANFLLTQSHKGNLVHNVERYIYTSNKNANMLMDMFFLDNANEKLIFAANELAMVDTNQGTFWVNPRNLSQKEYASKSKKFQELLFQEAKNRITLPEPIYLGSSWNPPKRKEKISREDAVELLRGGFSPVEIAENYSGFSKMQLAALKAHYVTMGKAIA